MKIRRISVITRLAAVLVTAAIVSGCLISCNTGVSQTVTTDTGNNYSSTDISGNTQTGITDTGDATATVTSEEIPDITISEQPSEGTYTPSSTDEVTISLSDDGIGISGAGAYAVGSVLTVSSAGTYILSGTLTDGKIIVNTADETKVKLILNGVSVTCDSGAALEVINSPKKVILYSAENSVNLFSDGTKDYIVPDDEQTEDGYYPNACIYSKEDLKLDGSGTINIVSNWGNGISSSDDLEFAGGSVNITAANNGAKGKDSLTVTGGILNVNAKGDGLKSTNSEDEAKGFITLSAGEIYLTTTGDGISAQTDLTVSGGKLVIKTAGTGMSTASSGTGSTLIGFRPGGHGGFGGMDEGNKDKSATSAKGLKATGTVTISDSAAITITSADDGIHSDDTVIIGGGSIYISASDDGIHADKVLTVNSGTVDIVKSYEGIESKTITINGGTVRVVSSDDGFNASDGTATGGMGGRPGSQTTSADAPVLNFNGGYVYVNASGDGIDSNGYIKMTGGTVIVMGPTNNGNGAIDFGDGGYNMTISGGFLLAAGSSGMAETATNNGQAVVAFTTRSSMSADTLISVYDADGTLVAAFAPCKTFTSVVFSCPGLTSESGYTVKTGGSSTGTVTDTIYSAGEITGASELGTINAK